MTRIDSLIHDYQIKIRGDRLAIHPTGRNKSVPAEIIAEIKENKEAIIARIKERNEKRSAELASALEKESHTCSRCGATGAMKKVGINYFCKECHALLTQVGFGERTALEDITGRPHRVEPEYKAD
jgi:ribosomal protein L37AE/L43A